MNDILKELETELVNLRWSVSRKNGRKCLDIADKEEQPKRYFFIAGLIRDYIPKTSNNHTQSLVISSATNIPKHQRAIELATKYMDLYDPSFPYTSIQFSRCMKTPRHVDKFNVGLSVIVGVGDYTGGSLDIYDGEEVEEVDIHRTPYNFNAGNTYHSTGDFSGDRITITFFSVKDFK